MEFDVGFGIVEIMFAIIFVIVVGTILVAFVKSIGEWNKNNHAPRLSVSAQVVSKRFDVSHSAGNQTTGSSSFTSYYVTFQVESGDRMEFSVEGGEYGMLVEGDLGKLTFQGTRYLSFERA